MPSKLSGPPEEQVRQYLADTLRPTEIEGYDPQQTDQTATDFLPVTNDWSYRGDYYPIIFVGEQESPTVPNSGQTGYNGLQSDGSGPNITNRKNITVSCQAVQGGAYLNQVDADDLVYTLYQEVKHQIQNNPASAISDALYLGITPSTQTRSSDETDSGSTENWVQRAGTIYMGVIDEP